MQINTTLGSNYTPTRKAETKKSENSVGKNVLELESHTLQVRMQNDTTLENSKLRFTWLLSIFF